MTTAMRAAVLERPGKFKVGAVDRPQPRLDEALIRIDRTGICGTDIHIFHGRYAAEFLPMIPGHEFTGRIAELGPHVKGWEIGQQVVVDMNIGCTTCYWCRRNEVLNCPDMQQMGINIDGAFAEYIAVPARLLIAAPENTPSEILALTEPLACVVRAARKSRVTFGQSVTVIGAGPIGNLHVQLLRNIGVAPIIVTDINQSRLLMAKESGADIAVPPHRLKEAVLTATQGRGTDMVIECVGDSTLYAEALEVMRKGGHLAAFGLTGPDDEIDINIVQMILQENSIKGSVAGIGEDMHDALTLLTHHRIKTSPFTGAEFPLDDIQTAFDTFADRPDDLKTQIVM